MVAGAASPSGARRGSQGGTQKNFADLVAAAKREAIARDLRAWFFARALPLAPLGVWIGVTLARRIDARLFYRLIHWGMGLTGVKLVWDGWF